MLPPAWGSTAWCHPVIATNSMATVATIVMTAAQALTHSGRRHHRHSREFLDTMTPLSARNGASKGRPRRPS